MSGDDAGQAAAIRYFDNVASAHQALNGSFFPYPSSEGGPDIQTVSVVNALGEAYVVLGDRLDATRKAAWASSITRGADYLIKNGNLHWYTNGNINLADTLAMAIAFKVSGDAKYDADTQDALAFAMAPAATNPMWSGMGFTYLTQPTRADGSDGSAYFTETGAGGTGFDPDYVQVQLDVVTWWYLISHNDTALRMENLLLNSLMPRIDPNTWALDASGGTRHIDANRHIGFNSAALIVLATMGHRPELLTYANSQLAAICRTFATGEDSVNPSMAWGYGSEYAAAIWASGGAQ